MIIEKINIKTQNKSVPSTVQQNILDEFTKVSGLTSLTDSRNERVII